jgi:hypothetical protein
MFTYHKVIYRSNNSIQINNLLLITRNQLLNDYNDNIYLHNLQIKKKIIPKRKYMINKYSYHNISLNTLFFNHFFLMLLLYCHFKIIFIITLV